MGRDAGRGSGRVWLMQGRGSLVKRGATSEKGSFRQARAAMTKRKARPESPPRGADVLETTALSTGRRRLSWTTLSSSAVRVFPPDARSGGLQWQRWLALGLRQSRQLRDSRDNLGAREGCGPKKSLPCRANWWRGCCAQRFPSGSSTICCEPVVPVNMYLHRRTVCG